MYETCELRKFDSREEKSTTVEAQDQIYSRRELGKPDSHEQKYDMIKVQYKICPRHMGWENPTWVKRKFTMIEVRQNVSEMHESRKPNPYEESNIIEIEDKMCLRCVSWKNPTYMMRNPSRWRHKAKYARGAQVKKTRHMRNNLEHSRVE